MVSLTGRPDMTLDVYRGRKITMQQQQQKYTEVVTAMSRSPQAGSTNMEHKYGSLCINGGSLDARLRSVFLFGNTQPTCMPLSGHFMDGWMDE